MDTIYTIMMDYIKTEQKRFTVAEFMDDFVVVNNETHKVVDWGNTRQEAEANAHFLNCQAFAIECINARDEMSIRMALDSKDKTMRSAFLEMLVDSAMKPTIRV